MSKDVNVAGNTEDSKAVSKDRVSARTTSPVVFVESYPQVIAGQQRTLISLLETWSETEIPAIVFVPGDGIYVEKLRELGVDVRIVPQPAMLDRYGGQIYQDGWRKKWKTWSATLTYVREIRRILRKQRVQGVFCNDMRGILTAGIAARSLGLPVMTWDKLDKPHGRLDLIELPLLQRVAIISNAVLTKFPQWQVRWFNKKIVLVPNGADLSRFDSACSARIALGLSDENIVAGIVGTVCERKGQDRILEVWPELARRFPNAILLIVGSWEDAPEHVTYYNNLPSKDHPGVRFLGSRASREMPGIMQSLDILAVPSRHEGMGQVVAEAMACRIPVAGSNAGGIPEIVKDGETGMIYDGESSADILEKLSSLFASSELRERMGKSGRVRVEESYNRPRQMQRICDLFQEVLPKARRRVV